MLVSIPGLGAGFQKFVKFCIDELTWRVNNSGDDKDGTKNIMSSLLKAYKGIDDPEEDPMLLADARLIIVAGSDTTASALTYLFYHLALDPSQQKKLRKELAPLAVGDWSDKDIIKAPHLNGAIFESLRLHPPVPSGVSRLTPKEGMKVGDIWISGNTTFIIPLYVMQRRNDPCHSIPWSTDGSICLHAPQTINITKKPSLSSRSAGTARTP